MQVYLFDIYLSLVFFPLVAGLLTLPYLIYQYRRYGAIPWQKTLLFFIFVLYLLCAYFLVIMPLPADREALVPYAQTPQLVPLHVISDIVKEAESSSLFGALTGPAVYEALFNVLLLIPLGMILRYYLKRTWWQALLIGLALSLFFELSQLTGLFGLYEHPYRLFDVDDLLFNTFGALVGYWIALPVSKVLPDIDAITERKAQSELRASVPRRLASLIIDLLLVSLLSVAIIVLIGFALDALGLPESTLNTGALNVLLTLLIFGTVFVLVPTITKGQTIGQKAVRIALVKTDGQRPGWYQYVANYGLFLLFLYAPFWLSDWFVTTDASTARDLEPLVSFVQSNLTVFALVWAAIALAWLISLIVRIVQSRRRDTSLVLLSDFLSNTRMIALKKR